ncbi:MAG: hypothetical protein NTY53_13670 [Kiritimatiellaeota bacterium]|nr:hypothetical protein [Kiritimatiellota bacterium]
MNQLTFTVGANRETLNPRGRTMLWIHEYKGMHEVPQSIMDQLPEQPNSRTKGVTFQAHRGDSWRIESWVLFMDKIWIILWCQPKGHASVTEKTSYALSHLSPTFCVGHFHSDWAEAGEQDQTRAVFACRSDLKWTDFYQARSFSIPFDLHGKRYLLDFVCELQQYISNPLPCRTPTRDEVKAFCQEVHEWEVKYNVPAAIAQNIIGQGIEAGIDSGKSSMRSWENYELRRGSPDQ